MRAQAGLSLVFQAVQIGNDVGTVFGFAQPRKGHIGARGIFLRVFQKAVQRFVIPYAVFAGQGGGLVKAGRHGNVAVDNAPKRRPDFICAANVETVARHAFFRDFDALLDRSGLQ